MPQEQSKTYQSLISGITPLISEGAAIAAETVSTSYGASNATASIIHEFVEHTSNIAMNATSNNSWSQFVADVTCSTVIKSVIDKMYPNGHHSALTCIKVAASFSIKYFEICEFSKNASDTETDTEIYPNFYCELDLCCSLDPCLNHHSISNAEEKPNL